MTTPVPPVQAAQLEAAKKELTKLPLLGPALWLFARDPSRKFTFVADIDWRLLPPLVLDQCRLFNRSDIPWAFATWAFVSDAVAERLRSATPIIAPHEWKSGDKQWLIDVVAPFGDVDATAAEVARQLAVQSPVSAWITGSDGRPVLKEFRSRE